eukprot:jgi/Tetstr1/434461/TSEL_002497.t1
MATFGHQIARCRGPRSKIIDGREAARVIIIAVEGRTSSATATATATDGSAFECVTMRAGTLVGAGRFQIAGNLMAFIRHRKCQHGLCEARPCGDHDHAMQSCTIDGSDSSSCAKMRRAA